MKNYLFLGDTHGDLDFVERAADLAAEHDATIIQVGDWGFLWPGSDQLSMLNSVLKMAGQRAGKDEYAVHMRFIDGNHDWHPELRKRATKLASNVTYQPRGSTYVDVDGTGFLFMGGAPSIDQVGRIEGLSWWPEEDITQGEYKRAIENPHLGSYADVIVTHDAPDYPIGFKPLGSGEFRRRSKQSHDYVRGMMEHYTPALLVHGHWHKRYMIQCDQTKVHGLDCNYGKFPDGVMLWQRES
jgi:UDP-2,3-diacylglucosamine pyrophosphatase LpxH